MNRDLSSDIDQLRDDLVEVSQPEKAAPMAAYMKDNFEFLGVTSPNRSIAQRPWVKEWVAAGPEVAVSAARLLWAEPEREFQHVGCDLMRRVAKKLPASNVSDVRWLIIHKSWWDTVDSLAKVLGAVVSQHPELYDTLDEWVTDPDMWLARSALLHQLSWKEQGDPVVVFSYCEQQIDHEDFFIRKAIGWALRDLARSYPDEVWGFVDSHPGLSGLSKREATKHR